MIDMLDATHESTTLFQLLSNPLILHQTTPYLPISSLLALGVASKSFQDLIYHTTQVFRHVDLTNVRSVQFEVEAIDHGGEIWRNVQLDENVTEDDFYAGPLRGAFNQMTRRHILQDVQTLVLDGLSVTSELIGQIILDSSFNVRLLSVREVKHLNERKLMKVLEYAVRPSRPANTPKLRGLYIFGPKYSNSSSPNRRRMIQHQENPDDAQPHYGGTSSVAQIGAHWNERSENALSQAAIWDGDNWFRGSGKMIPRPTTSGWPETIKACDGIISFDAILCNGPRHRLSSFLHNSEQPSKLWYERREAYLPPMLSTHSLESCSMCQSSPEGFSIHGQAPLEAFPLLPPVPLHSSSIKVAKMPSAVANYERPLRLLARCQECIRNRYCENCHKWWCEDCYEVPNPARTSAPSDGAGTIAELPGNEGKSHATATNNVKVHMGLCIQYCLVDEMMSGPGSSGMWG